MWLKDKDYNFIYSRAPRLCVDLVIKNSEGILLTFRTIEPFKNTWHLPGGRVGFRESLHAACMRIAQKELGLKIKVIKELDAMEFLKEKQAGNPRHSVSLAFLVRPIGKMKKTDFQSSQAKFFKIFPKKIIKQHLKVIQQAF